MGKQQPAGIETRIHDAMSKADADGYERMNMRWHLTRESWIEFVSCAAYIEKPYGGYSQFEPLWCGMIGDVMVYLDPKLKGKIAELRPIEGIVDSQYAITLDFSEAPANTDRAQLRTWRQERG
jgi:hypothetical protein